MHPDGEKSMIECECWFCSASSRRKRGWWFTAGSTYWCKRNPCPRSTEIIYNVSLFEDVLGDRNHHDMKMCNLVSFLHVLKFCSGWVWASVDDVNEISIWLQILEEGYFLRFSRKKWKKMKFWTDANLEKLPQVRKDLRVPPAKQGWRFTACLKHDTGATGISVSNRASFFITSTCL